MLDHSSFILLVSSPAPHPISKIFSSFKGLRSSTISLPYSVTNLPIDLYDFGSYKLLLLMVC
ncbi:Hypothetical protein FNO222_1281 [Francisella orientalis]|uniref:Uncharacterized protein n=1 Tax=Francisella orientalis TaxID=299583 RepID=A0ABM5U6R0_9GAMM|nr:hypothetical protein FNO12_1269 [Francisella orientalis FNO12]AKN87393.1 Hypothetical protein FNO24_1271 [Francisella orientalis FNO24]AKN88930.1 Hypothetical protein FNO190_1269 [Francisella orientalis]AKU05690.1 Hypothetical protein FNO01_1269 [Francisella orientalis]QEN20604.1 Hypothetical protein FNO39_1281 [Francisella orientalis]